MSTQLVLATEDRAWPDELRRRLVVGLGGGAGLSSLHTTELWTRYLNALAVRPRGALAARLRVYAPEYPTEWAGLKLPTQVLTLTEAAPDGQVLVAYSYQFNATGGTPAYSYAVSAGAPPTGTTLSATGLLSGTPSTAGAYNFTVRATDAAGVQASVPVAITIIP